MRKSWQMQFRDKTAYVWGLRYQWDPSLSRNPVPRFPHIMPPWCDAVESNETHGCPARHYFAILSMSLSPGSYCNDSDAVAGVIRARLNAAISESPQADQTSAGLPKLVGNCANCPSGDAMTDRTSSWLQFSHDGINGVGTPCFYFRTSSSMFEVYCTLNWSPNYRQMVTITFFA